MSSLEEISSILRRWPRGFRPQHRDAARETLRSCAEVYEASHAVMAWEESDEPWIVIATYSASEYDCIEAAADRFLPLTDPSIAEVSFSLSADGRIVTSAGQCIASGQSLVNQNLRNDYHIGAAVSLPVRGDTIEGRVFLLDAGNSTPEMLLVGEAIGALVAAQFDSATRMESQARDAVADERMRVARDLHDGLLQSFTGVVLRLETVHSILEENPDQARNMLTEVQASIMADQRELRAYVEKLGPRHRAEMKFDFRGRLDEWRERFEKQWNVSVRFDGERLDPLVAELLGHETLRLIQEAVTNSAKHGGASAVDVNLTTRNGRMIIEVSDNGGGFPFHGRRTLEEIRGGAGGPGVLAQRVAALNGDLIVESGENGARIEISVPLGFSSS
jgi:signal transduction histidine kinase